MEKMTIPIKSNVGIYRMLIVIMFYCMAFMLDHETKHFTDLFQVGNIIALIVYAVPTYLICWLFYRLFARMGNYPLVWSLVVGLPAGFMIVMVLLAMKMGRV
jgi:hypothetical protein